MTMADHQGVLLRLHHLWWYTACEANIPHMEHRTPRGVASTHPICVTTPEAAEKGGGSQVQLVHRAGASLRLQTRPPRALAEEFTSPSETLLRAVMPGSTQLPMARAMFARPNSLQAQRIEFMRAQVDPARMLHQREHVPGQQVWHRQLAPAIAHARLFRRAECHPLMIPVRLERDRQVNRRSGSACAVAGHAVCPRGIARDRWCMWLVRAHQRSCGTCAQCIDNSSS
jgi:hypothetical protein